MGTSWPGRPTSITMTATTPGGRAPGQVPRWQCPPPLQGAGAAPDHPRPRHRDRAPGLVADRGGDPRLAEAGGGGHPVADRRITDVLAQLLVCRGLEPRF